MEVRTVGKRGGMKLFVRVEESKEGAIDGEESLQSDKIRRSTKETFEIVNSVI